MQENAEQHNIVFQVHVKIMKQYKNPRFRVSNDRSSDELVFNISDFSSNQVWFGFTAYQPL